MVKKMIEEWIGETVQSIKSIKLRQALSQIITLGMIITTALMIWKALILFTGSESPVVVVLSGSMEPGFERGDILLLHMSNDPIRTGEIVVFNIDGREIPIVHRVIKVHEREEMGEVDVLTKGDNNYGDDRSLYARGQRWLNRKHIMGRAVGYMLKYRTLEHTILILSATIRPLPNSVTLRTTCDILNIFRYICPHMIRGFY